MLNIFWLQWTLDLKNGVLYKSIVESSNVVIFLSPHSTLGFLWTKLLWLTKRLSQFRAYKPIRIPNNVSTLVLSSIRIFVSNNLDRLFPLGGSTIVREIEAWIWKLGCDIWIKIFPQNNKEVLNLTENHKADNIIRTKCNWDMSQDLEFFSIKGGSCCVIYPFTKSTVTMIL